MWIASLGTLSALLALPSLSSASGSVAARVAAQAVTSIRAFAPLKESHGVAFQFNTHEWSASTLEGAVTGHRATSPSPLTWLGSSIISSTLVEAESGADLRCRCDVLAVMTDLTGLPHFKMSLLEYAQETRLVIDLTPRMDMLAHEDYFRLVFKGFDEELTELTERHALRHSSAFPRLLTRMVASPFKLDVSVLSDAAEAVLGAVCTLYVDRLRALMAEHADRQLAFCDAEELLRRDTSLHEMLYDELRFSFAETMCSEFAPRAADVAASLVGANPRGDLYLALSLAKGSQKPPPV